MSVGDSHQGTRRWVGPGFETAGLAGGLLWVTVSAADPDTEVARNRIWTLALFGMSLGVFGLFRRLSNSLGRVARVTFFATVVGLGLMTVASFVEYWILFGLPHEGAGWGPMARGIAWMTFLIGTLILVVSSAVTGCGMLLVGSKPMALGLLLALLAPVTVALAFVGPGVAALPLAALSSFGFVNGRREARGRAET